MSGLPANQNKTRIANDNPARYDANVSAAIKQKIIEGMRECGLVSLTCDAICMTFENSVFGCAAPVFPGDIAPADSFIVWCREKGFAIQERTADYSVVIIEQTGVA